LLSAGAIYVTGVIQGGAANYSFWPQESLKIRPKLFKRPFLGRARRGPI
jgi:hypothetical protein